MKLEKGSNVKKIYLDTGVIMLQYQNELTSEIRVLYDNILKNNYKAFVYKPVLTELAYHLCQLYGKDHVATLILSFIQKYDINIIEVPLDIIFDAGILRAQHPQILSYNDCLILAGCAQQHYILHTTEKEFTKILQVELANKIKIVKYRFK
jgi:predicted nucleic acid-binding protein